VIKNAERKAEVKEKNMDMETAKTEKEALTEGALCLEGGSLRGLFTCGVLDVLMENNLYFSYVNGVSAGAMCGMSYLSRQIGRTKRVNIDFLHDRRYISVKNLFRNRQIFNFDFLFGRLSNEYLPFDWKKFFDSPQKFEVVATRCTTGQAEYFDKDTCSSFVAALSASASIPVLSRMVTIDGKKYLDGGISVPVAYRRAMDLGYRKMVVVLTREKGFVKQQEKQWFMKGYERYFKPLPEFLSMLKDRPERYNRMTAEMEELENKGEIMIIRPEKPVEVKRIEQDPKKLEELYEEGRAVMEKSLPKLKEYLGIQ